MVNGSPNHLSLQRQPRFLLETGLLFLATVLLLADLFVSWRSPIGVRSEPDQSPSRVLPEFLRSVAGSRPSHRVVSLEPCRRSSGVLPGSLWHHVGILAEPEPSPAGVFAEPSRIPPESSRSFFGALPAFFWSPARILMASCRNLGGARAEYCWSFRGALPGPCRHPAGIMSASCRNHGGVFAGPYRHPVGVVPELWRSHGGALAESCPLAFDYCRHAGCRCV